MSEARAPRRSGTVGRLRCSIPVSTLVVLGLMTSTTTQAMSPRGGDGGSRSVPTSTRAGATPRGQAVSPAAPVGTERVARLLRLDSRLKELRGATLARARARDAARFTDTLQVGVFRVATSSDLRVSVREAALVVSRELQTHVDAATDRSMRGQLILVRHPTASEMRQDGSTDLVVALDGATSGLQTPSPLRFTKQDRLEQRFRDMAAQTIGSSFDDALHGWLFNATLTWPEPSDDLLQRARIDVATADANSASDCANGEVTACGRLLMLHGRPADPLDDWYARTDYRAVVRRLRLAPTDGREAPQLQRACLRGNTAMCETLLKTLAPERIPSPTLDAPRLIYFHEAIRLGGAGALARLRDTRGDIGTRLAAASGVSESALLESWRRRLMEGSAARARPTALAAVGALGGTLLLAGVSLRRTRRCS